MINLFKQGAPIYLPALILIMLATRLHFLFEEPAQIGLSWDSPFDHVLLPLHEVSTRLLLSLVAGLHFVSALLISNLMNRLKILPRLNQLASLAFILISGALPQFQVDFAMSVVVLLIILSFRSVSLMLRPDAGRAHIADSGLFLGIAILLYQPVILLLLLLIPALYTFRPFSLKDGLLLLSGVLAVLSLAFTSSFWFDQQDVFFNWLNPALGDLSVNDAVIGSSFYQFVPIVIALGLGFSALDRYFSSSLIHFRKFYSSVFIMLGLFFVLCLFYRSETSPSILMLCVPASLIVSPAFFGDERVVLKELLLWLALATIVVLPILL